MATSSDTVPAPLQRFEKTCRGLFLPCPRLTFTTTRPGVALVVSEFEYIRSVHAKELIAALPAGYALFASVSTSNTGVALFVMGPSPFGGGGGTDGDERQQPSPPTTQKTYTLFPADPPLAMEMNIHKWLEDADARFRQIHADFPRSMEGRLRVLVDGRTQASIKAALATLCSVGIPASMLDHTFCVGGGKELGLSRDTLHWIILSSMASSSSSHQRHVVFAPEGDARSNQQPAPPHVLVPLHALDGEGVLPSFTLCGSIMFLRGNGSVIPRALLYFLIETREPSLMPQTPTEAQGQETKAKKRKMFW